MSNYKMLHKFFFLGFIISCSNDFRNRDLKPLTRLILWKYYYELINNLLHFSFVRLKRLKSTGVTNFSLKELASLKLFNGYFLFYLNYQKVTAQFFKLSILFIFVDNNI